MLEGGCIIFVKPPFHTFPQRGNPHIRALFTGLERDFRGGVEDAEIYRIYFGDVERGLIGRCIGVGGVKGGCMDLGRKCWVCYGV